MNQLNVIVADVDATVAFYRRLGVPIDAEPGAYHVAVTFPNGFLVEFDSVASVSQWDTGAPGTTGGSAVFGFALPSRDAVDATFADVTSAGYRGRQPPYDAFWGARYAIVEDPDGNGVGLMSPPEKDRRFWPPTEPPRT
jgi:catechol 2,3-dioxygenase-like lactoylglutathione lyase family enzyme